MQGKSVPSAVMYVLWLAWLGLGTMLAQAPGIPPEVLAYPEIILYNGEVLTADDQFTNAEAMAIRGDQILTVGSTGDIRRLAGPQTRQIDLNGRSVVPGFFDTHLHQAWVGQVAKGGGEGGFEEVRKGRVGYPTVGVGLQEIRKIVATAKPGDWLYLSGPDNKALIQETTLEHLDQASPANPLVITTVNNLALANSMALKTIDWDIGGVEMNPQTGKPTGRVSGFAVGALTYERMPVPGRPTAESLRAQQEVLRRLNSQGLTTIMGRAQGTSVSVLKELWENGLLTARVRIAHEFLRQNARGEDYLKRLGNLSGFGDSWMKIIGTTVQPVDGTSNAGAIFTTMPKRREMPDSPFGSYGQNKYENWGSTLEKSEYHNIILANRYGWNVLSVHSQGDGAADLLLKAYEEASKEAPLTGTWAFDHGLVRNAHSIAKAQELGVVFSVAPKYLFQNSPVDLTYQFGEAVHRMTPVRAMIEAGLKPVMESDITGDWSSPLLNMEGLITRTDEKGSVWGQNQKITRQEALWMKTNWASRYSGDEKILGTITPGKLADLVVLGGSYTMVPESQISDLPVDFTIVNGKIVYDRARDGLIRSPLWDTPRRGAELPVEDRP